MALLAAVMAPTLALTEFSRTLENLNVATALEARRDGHWLKPTLEGQPRTVKPPLMAWITALAISPKTVEQCSSPNATIRDAAYRRLAFEARWPALAIGCLTILAVYALGCVIADANLGAASALIVAASFGLLRFSQVAMVDVPLTLFVAVAHAFFALTAFRGRRWGGLIGAGIAVGLAFMSKGPAALMETALPWALWAIWMRVTRTPLESNRRNWLGPIIAAVIAFLAIATPWYLIMLFQRRGAQIHEWWLELSGEDAANDRGEPFFTYLWVIWELLFPWVLFFAGGLWLAFAARRRQQVNPSPDPDNYFPRYALLLIAILVPLVLFSIRKEKKDRYLLPILAPAAVLTARAALAYLQDRPRSARHDWVGATHWIILAVPALAVPALGLTKLPHQFTGLPAFSLPYASAALALAVALLLAGLFIHLTRRPGFLFITLLLMLLTAHVFTVGYANTLPGQSEMKPLADAVWHTYPDAQLFTTQPFGIRASTDLSIYMNRTTAWTTPQDMAAAQPSAKPQVVIMRQRAKEPMPHPGDQWHLFMTLPKGDGSFWHAFVLPPSQ